MIQCDGKFWNEDQSEFVDGDLNGTLYGEWGPPSVIVQNMIIKDYDKQEHTFIVPLQITVRSDEVPDIVDVAKWAHKVMEIVLNYESHGKGPVEDSVGTTLIEWDQIQKARTK
jgi:hypothetical protein